MYDDLKGKTVVVTGSSKGLGAAMARRFGAEGMNVVANYRSDEEGARETVRAIEEAGGAARAGQPGPGVSCTLRGAGGAAAAVQADVSKDECVDALFDAAMFSFGGVDIWVNNAGIEVASPSDRKSIEEWQRVIDVNLTGVFAAAPSITFWIARCPASSSTCRRCTRSSRGRISPTTRLARRASAC